MLVCNLTNTSAGKRKCANVSKPYCAKCQLFGQLFIRRLVQSSLQQQGFLCSGGAPPDLPHGAGPEKHPEPGVRDAMELPIPSRASSALDSKRVKFSAGLWGISGCNSGGILSGSRDSTGRDAFSGFTWQTDRLEGGLGPARSSNDDKIKLPLLDSTCDSWWKSKDCVQILLAMLLVVAPYVGVQRVPRDPGQPGFSSSQLSFKNSPHPPKIQIFSSRSLPLPSLLSDLVVPPESEALTLKNQCTLRISMPEVFWYMPVTKGNELHVSSSQELVKEMVDADVELMRNNPNA
ncbi:hypothetical protein Anapl_04194 [Anas platyrhynchos]|uniref:Uncharacterized protein n=1 Tax=Anas platyrhynchos TaxID=8839 RepID=R0JP30_ANAPL|nr:hypothetical protein Anapl_04194 [Anas platyrhynchos]